MNFQPVFDFSAKVHRLKLAAEQMTGKDAIEVHLSFQDYAELESNIGMQLKESNGLPVVPDPLVENGAIFIVTEICR
jgi:hypothetical protein